MPQGKYFYPPVIVTYYNLKTKVRSLDMKEEGESLLRDAQRPVKATKAIKEEGQAVAEQAQDISQQLQAFKQETARPQQYKIVIHDRPTKDHSVRVKTADGNDA